MMVNLPCLWGSVSQLPSSHLFIHRVPTKLSNGIFVPRRVLLLATAPVCEWIITGSADLTQTCRLSGGRDTVCTVSGSSAGVNTPFSGFPIQNPARIPNISVCRQSPGCIFNTSSSYQSLGSRCKQSLRNGFWSHYVRHHFLRVVMDAFLEHRIDDPQQLARDHN